MLGGYQGPLAKGTSRNNVARGSFYVLREVHFSDKDTCFPPVILSVFLLYFLTKFFFSEGFILCVARGSFYVLREVPKLVLREVPFCVARGSFCERSLSSNAIDSRFSVVFEEKKRF